MLGVLTGSVVDTQHPPGASLLNVTNKNSPHFFHGILAAAQVSSSLSMIDIEVVGDEDSDDWDSDEEENVAQSVFTMDKWKWVAYALLSRDARHRIKTLMVDLKSLRSFHVDAMREIIAASDPLARLNYSHLEWPDRQLTARRFLITDPEDETRRTRAVYSAPEPTTVRVACPPDDDYPYWTVLLPGFGDAWVLKDDAANVIELETPTDDWRTAIPSFERIDISASEDSCLDAAASLLELIGHGTKELIVHNHEDDGSLDDWTRQVLHACPNLEALTFGLATVESMKVFVDCAEEGKSHLQKLFLSSTFTEHAVTFLRALVDPTHPVAIHLREFKTNFQIEKKNQIAPVVRAIQDVLENNRRLYTINIAFRLPGELESMSTDIETAFGKYNKDEITIRVAPLELRSKLAMLSVVHTCKSKVLSQLDSSVLRLVFQFAAPCRKRRVRIEPTTSRAEELQEEWGIQVGGPLAAMLWG